MLAVSDGASSIKSAIAKNNLTISILIFYLDYEICCL